MVTFWLLDESWGHNEFTLVTVDAQKGIVCEMISLTREAKGIHPELPFATTATYDTVTM